jgi:DNA-binding NarL/FixJ family response regulator
MSESEALQFLHAGAVGVVRKTASVADLIACIRAVVSGGSWMEQDLVRDPEQPVRTGRSALTSRELQVVELVERGMKNKDIGASLGICTGTVKIHIKHIFEKTGIRGVTAWPRWSKAVGAAGGPVAERFPSPGRRQSVLT